MGVLASIQAFFERLTGGTTTRGDIGQFLTGEALSGASALQTKTPLPQITATWTARNTHRTGLSDRKVVRVRGCSTEDLNRLFKALLEALKTSDAQEYHDGASFGFRTGSGNYHFFDHATGFTVHIPAALFVVITRPRGPLLFIERGPTESSSASQPFPQIIGKGYSAHMALPRSDRALLWLSVVAALSAACLPVAIRFHQGGLFKALGVFGLFFGPALLGLSVLESARYEHTWRVLLAIAISFAARRAEVGTGFNSCCVDEFYMGFDGQSLPRHNLGMKSGIIFEVTEAEEGGYCASALGFGINTQADSLDQLRTMVRDAVNCYFDNPDQAPRIIRFDWKMP